MREWFAGECASRGLDLSKTGWETSGPGGAIRTPVGRSSTGSHLDSVPDGGAFDGPLGVVSGLLAIDQLDLTASGRGRPIGVVNFVDEEGARFGVSCAGSRVITGVLSPRSGAGRCVMPMA